ncbi:MAG: hypothetical protein MJ191_01795 [Clostridium sp.]|nr:hypothetical protein [Clostridium sp.]
MNKKRISIILSGLLMMTMVSCTNKDTTDDLLGNSEIKIMEDSTTQGKWLDDYSRDEVKELHEEILEKIENACVIYELQDEYSLHEEVKDENGTTVNRNGLYLEIPKPESNRVESMTYELVQYGTDLSSGQLTLKIGFNLDKKAIKEEGKFEFEMTAMSTFSEAFTGDDDRDYSKLNKEIYDIISNKSGISKIENTIDGLSETITITDNYLLYTLESKEYSFK